MPSPLFCYVKVVIKSENLVSFRFSICRISLYVLVFARGVCSFGKGFGLCDEVWDFLPSES